MEIPSGRRSSEPMPVPTASGTAPNSAAIVVIMIGRKRSIDASKIESRVFLPSLRSALSAKSIIMMAFFLTMPISRMMPMMRHHIELGLGEHQGENGAHAGRRQRGENRDRMNEALVENSQHDIDRENRGQDQVWLVVSDC